MNIDDVLKGMQRISEVFEDTPHGDEVVLWINTIEDEIKRLRRGYHKIICLTAEDRVQWTNMVLKISTDTLYPNETTTD